MMAPIQLSPSNTIPIPELASLNNPTPTPEEIQRRISSPPTNIPGSYPSTPRHHSSNSVISVLYVDANGSTPDYDDGMSSRFPSPAPPRKGASTPYPLPLIAERAPPPKPALTFPSFGARQDDEIGNNPLTLDKTCQFPHVMSESWPSSPTQTNEKHVHINAANIPLPLSPNNEDMVNGNMIKDDSSTTSSCPNTTRWYTGTTLTGSSSDGNSNGKVVAQLPPSHLTRTPPPPMRNWWERRCSPQPLRAPIYPVLPSSTPIQRLHALSHANDAPSDKEDTVSPDAETQSQGNWSTTSPDKFSLVHILGPKLTRQQAIQRSETQAKRGNRPLSPSLIVQLQEEGEEEEITIRTADIVDVRTSHRARSISRDGSSGHWVLDPSASPVPHSRSHSHSATTPYIPCPSGIQSPAESIASVASSRFHERLDLDGPAMLRNGDREVPEQGRMPPQLTRQKPNGEIVIVKVSEKEDDEEGEKRKDCVVRRWGRKAGMWGEKFCRRVRSLCRGKKSVEAVAKSF